MVAHRPARIVFAIYGPADVQQIAAWNRTWLRGRPFVYVPDAPSGPFARNYRPRHAGKNGYDYSAHTPVDANMVWAVALANSTYPRTDWVFVVDSDSFVFPRAVERSVRRLNARLPRWYAPQRLRRPKPKVVDPLAKLNVDNRYPCFNCTPDTSFGTARRPPRPRDCCICPVSLRRVDSDDGAEPKRYAIDARGGTALYRAAQHSLPYGGTGVLLSRGLLDAIPSAAWTECARRLQCGTSDFRLAVCVWHFLPHLKVTHTHANQHFLDYQSRAYLRAITAAFGKNLPNHDFSPKSPMMVGKMAGSSAPVRETVLRMLRAGAPCPWSLHKLPPEHASAVHNASVRRCV